MKLEQFQWPKDAGGLGLPNPWLYYLTSQLQLFARAMHPVAGAEVGYLNPSTRPLLHTVDQIEIASGLGGLELSKSNKLYPSYVLMQRTWNKPRQLQQVTGFTRFSPIWGNAHYSDLALIHYGAK